MDDRVTFSNTYSGKHKYTYTEEAILLHFWQDDFSCGPRGVLSLWNNADITKADTEQFVHFAYVQVPVS